MAIRAPGPRLLADTPFRFIAARGGGKKKVDANVALIPFIDFLLVVVVFLLMSFSASGQVTAHADLPEAANGSPLDDAPTIVIDEASVTIDGRRMASTAALAREARLERIDPLVRDLEMQRASWPVLHPNEPFAGNVVVQAGRGVDFRVIRKVLFSVQQAGYGGIQLAVRER